MSCLGLVFILNKYFEKCKTCNKPMITKNKNPHRNVERNIKLLELIHIDNYKLE
jgi:hypothetical protein